MGGGAYKLIQNDNHRNWQEKSRYEFITLNHGLPRTFYTEGKHLP